MIGPLIYCPAEVPVVSMVDGIYFTHSYKIV